VLAAATFSSSTLSILSCSAFAFASASAFAILSASAFSNLSFSALASFSTFKISSFLFLSSVYIFNENIKTFNSSLIISKSIKIKCFYLNKML